MSKPAKTHDLLAKYERFRAALAQREEELLSEARRANPNQPPLAYLQLLAQDKIANQLDAELCKLEKLLPEDVETEAVLERTPGQVLPDGNLP